MDNTLLPVRTVMGLGYSGDVCSTVGVSRRVTLGVAVMWVCMYVC